MRLSRAGYTDSNWMDALAAGKKPNVAPTEAELAKDVMAHAIEAATGVKKPMTPDESVRKASAELHQQAVHAETVQHCSTIKSKLTDRGIDPIGLGVVSQKDWEGCSDPAKIEAIAKQAAFEFQKKQSLAWQEKAMTGTRATSRPDTETASAGRIMSTVSAGDDQTQKSRVAANQNSILDPDRLSRLFTQPETNEHDTMVAESAKERNEKHVRRAQEQQESIQKLADAPLPMNGSSVGRSGATQDGISSGMKAPSNQISMFDDLSKGAAEVFESKVGDAKSESLAAQAERRAAIKMEPKESKKAEAWNTEENLKPKTTSDLQGKLLSIWMPNAGE